jgi:hypothetical protein
MISPATLRADFTAALQGLTSLVALLGDDSANIKEYTQEARGDIATKIAQFTTPTLLVCYAGTGLTGRQTTLWFHRFELVLRNVDDPLAAYAAIVNGLLNSNINSGYHQMEPPLMDRHFIAISDTAQIDYWAITTGFSSKGTN